MEKKSKIFFIEIFFSILLIGSVSASNITIDYPEEVDVKEEFEVNLKLLDFPEDVYDVKIDIFCKEVRIAKILDESWKSTYYYINEAIEDSEEKAFNLKIEKECEEADIKITIKNSKETKKTFSDYKIECTENEDEIVDGEDSENLDEEGDSEENDDEDETDKKAEESSVKIESTDEKTEENVDLKPIVLNAQSIKSENDKEFSTKNLAFYGVIGFCVVFGALFFLKKRKYKNEFQ